MRAVAPVAGSDGRGGRWIWGVSGVLTALVLGALGVLLILRPGLPGLTAYAVPQHSMTRTVIIGQPVTGVTVDSYGAPVSAQSGDVRSVRVIETTMWSGTESAPDVPPVTQTISGGQLTLASPRCAGAEGSPLPAAASAPRPGLVPVVHVAPASADSASQASGTSLASDCKIAYDVVTPPGTHITVSSAGGPVTVSGADSATVNSGGGFVSAVQVTGALAVNSDGGIIRVDGLTGPLTADSGGAPETLGIPVSTRASRSITVSTGGGVLVVGSPGATGPGIRIGAGPRGGGLSASISLGNG
jgi:hypothetical protein